MLKGIGRNDLFFTIIMFTFVLMIKETKKCETCNKELSLDSFYLRKAAPNRYQADCKDCYKLKRNARYANKTKPKKRRLNFFVSRVNSKDLPARLKESIDKLEMAEKELVTAKYNLKKEREGEFHLSKELSRKRSKVDYWARKTENEKYWADYYARKAEEKEINDLL